MIKYLFRKEFEANMTNINSKVTKIFNGILPLLTKLRLDMISTNHYKKPGIEYLTYKYNNTHNILLRNKYFVGGITERKGKSLEKLKKAVAKLDEDINQVGTIKVSRFILSTPHGAGRRVLI